MTIVGIKCDCASSFNVISRKPEIVLSRKNFTKFYKQVGKLNYCRYCQVPLLTYLKATIISGYLI